MKDFLRTIALILVFIVLGVDELFVQVALVGLSLTIALLAMVVDTQRRLH